MKQSIHIPEEFHILPFFSKEIKELTYDSSQSFEQALQAVHFLYDIADYHKMDLYKPWEEIETAIPLVFESWKKNKENIAALFRLRKREETKAPMVLYAAHLISSLYWMNEGPVLTLSELESSLSRLTLKPVNLEERLGFILQQPNHYHSFIQLSELYEETEKLFFKAMVMKKRHLL
jgi:hypothetical protein